MPVPAHLCACPPVTRATVFPGGWLEERQQPPQQRPGARGAPVLLSCYPSCAPCPAGQGRARITSPERATGAPLSGFQSAFLPSGLMPSLIAHPIVSSLFNHVEQYLHPLLSHLDLSKVHSGLSAQSFQEQS